MNMAKVIEIRDRNQSGILTLELQDLLAFFNESGQSLIWSIQNLEAVGDPEKLKTDLLEIEEQAKKSPHGLILEWEDLLGLAQSLTDVWEVLIIACRNRELIPNLKHGIDRLDSCEIAIELFDSSYWRVCARDDAVIQRIADHCDDVTVSSL
jgi:hypothetical protein